MNRFECLGKPPTGSQKQLAVEVASAHAEMNKPNDKVGKKTATDKPQSLPACALLRPVQVSHQATQKSGFPRGDMLKAGKTLLLPGEITHAPPAAEPLPTNEKEHTEEEDVEDEDLKAPVKLIIEFLRAVMDRDFQLASRLCQMILIYEPDNPEASEFLPLIQKKLSEEQDEEQSTEEEEDDEEVDEDDDEDDDSGSDEESSQSSSCSSSSCSSSTSSDDEEEEVKPVNRHKPCPPSHICP